MTKNNLGLILLITIIISSSIAQDEIIYNLKDGTKLKGIVIEENNEIIKLATSFGTIEIKKEDILLKNYKVVLNSGETFIGEKQSETDQLLIIKTNFGNININKTDLLSIEEVGLTIKKELNHKYRKKSGLLGLFNLQDSPKDVDFSLGEEQLIDLFFDPTAYTLEQSTLYLSGLSFGFGITDQLQITTKWSGFIWGDMNFRPKYKIFEKGNWKKQQALSIGAHYHSRWWPNRYEWKNGSLQVNGQTKYWGGFYELGENPEYEYTDYYIDRIDNDDDNFIEMIELFGAYTTSTARSGLKGRISHTIGFNVQSLIKTNSSFYRVYYGLDIDINPRLKMISQIFYDPNFIEMWQMEKYNVNDNYWYVDDLSNTPLNEPSDFNPIHLDFGFIYAVNESFRFGIHFQQPWVAFYWKI